VRVRRLSLIALYAALYAGITISEAITVGVLAYGPIQVRVSDALLPLPMIHGIPAAIGLAIGCVVANIFTTAHPLDITLGSMANLISGILIVKASRGNPILACTYPVIIVSLIVGSYLPLLFPDFPIHISILTVFIGEAIAIYGIGLPLLKLIMRLRVESV